MKTFLRSAALFAGAAIAFSAALPANAETFNGSTTGGPVYNRPLTNGTAPPVSLSLVGTAVAYEVTPFIVSVSGSYSFLVTGLNPAGWDTYLGVHVNSFDPNDPLTNALAYNDDFPTIGLSGFTSLNLLAATSYFAVVSGFENSDAGAYSLAINGPGTVTFGASAPSVPEPTTWAMMAAGFGMIGFAARRRQKVSVSVAYARA